LTEIKRKAVTLKLLFFYFKKIKRGCAGRAPKKLSVMRANYVFFDENFTKIKEMCARPVPLE